MSDSMAIAAVTATLSSLLSSGLQEDPEIADAVVTTKPPDKAREAAHLLGNQINLFLYHVEHNPAWHDAPMPGQGRDAPPPLALTLHYLLTAYGQGDEDVKGHQLLGRAMRTLFDTPTLRTEDIQAAMGTSDLYEQVERVNITRQPMSVDDMSKLWTMFQTEYRISTAYQASVILIESRRGARAALPILRRGSQDQGVVSQPDTLPPFPEIQDVVILRKAKPGVPRIKPDSVCLGDTIQFKGHHLFGETVTMRFSNPRLHVTGHPSETDDVVVDPKDVADTLLTLPLPNDPKRFPAGVYTIAALVTDRKEVDGQVYSDEHVSNEVALKIIPEIEDRSLVLSLDVIRPDGLHDIEITLRCMPAIRPKQRVAVFLNGREVAIPPADHPKDTQDLVVGITAVVPDRSYVVRLRVDGVDSFPIVEQNGKLVFDPQQKIEVPA